MKFVKFFQNFKNTCYTWPLPHCHKIYKKQLLQYVLKSLDVLHRNLCLNLKLVSAIFLLNFHFQPNDSPSKTMKNTLYYISSKSSFRSPDILIFVFLSSFLFLPVSHCVRGCLKINHKVYDVINCLNKNLTHFV